MKAMMAVCKPGTGDLVDKYGNPVEPGNEIPIERRGAVGMDAGSIEMMPLDIVNGQWAKQHMRDQVDFIGGRINSGRHIEKQPPDYEHWFEKDLGVGEMHPGLERGLGMAKVLRMMGIV